MTHSRIAIAAGCLVLVASSVSAAEPERPVRYAWFPDFSPDGKLLVAPYGSWLADEAGEVRVWDVSTGEARFVIESPRGVRAVAWSSRGTFFASGDYGGHVRLYDAETGETIREFSMGPRDTVDVLQITPDESRVIAASRTGAVWVWSTEDGALVRTLSGHEGNIWGMRLAPDGEALATAGKDRTVRVWSIESGEQMYELDHPNVTNGVAFTSDSRVLATGCWDGRIRLWNLETGELMRTLARHSDAVNDLDFTSDDDRLVSGGSDRTLRMWDVRTGASGEPLVGHTAAVYGARFSPRDEIIASAAWDSTVRLWDVATGELLMTLER
jgi:WD40 repeat protein